jgi:hypothetical protein
VPPAVFAQKRALRTGNEQFGLVLNRSITMVIDGERRELHVGEMYLAPQSVIIGVPPHSLQGVSAARTDQVAHRLHIRDVAGVH